MAVRRGVEGAQNVTEKELFEDVAERIETDAFCNILMSPSPDGAHQKRALRTATLLTYTTSHGKPVKLWYGFSRVLFGKPGFCSYKVAEGFLHAEAG